MSKWILMVVAFFAVGSVYAGERLSGAQIEELLSGNTVVGEHHKRGKIRTFFSNDGTVENVSGDGTSRSGKWWVDGEKRCVRWNHKKKDLCHYIERNDDGTHTLVHAWKGKKLVDMQSIEAGNQL